MPRRFKSKRGGFRRAQRFVRRVVASTGPIEAKRIILDGFTINAKTSAAYDNPTIIDLIVSKETVDEEVESNGTTIAECPIYSKVVGMKGRFTVNSNIDSTTCIRWMLVKKPDGENLTTSLIDGLFHSSNDDPTSRELRGLILSKGMFVGSDRTAGSIGLFARRKTLRRLASLRENDKISLVLATNAASEHKIWGFGTLYVRMT